MTNELTREELIELNDRLQSRVVQLEDYYETILSALDGSDEWPLKSVGPRIRKLFGDISKEMYNE